MWGAYGTIVWAACIAVLLCGCSEVPRTVAESAEPDANEPRSPKPGELPVPPAKPRTPTQAPLPWVQDRVDFGTVPVGRWSNQLLELRNHDVDPLQLHVRTAAPFRVLDLPGGELTIAAGDRHVLYVQFEPMAFGGHTQELSVAFPSGTRTVTLEGVGAETCADECLEVDPASGRCRPVEDGAICGKDPHACSNGSACSAGICVQDRWPDGSACATPCGGPGGCIEGACFPPGGSVPPVVRLMDVTSLQGTSDGLNYHRGFGFTRVERESGNQELLAWKDGEIVWSAPTTPNGSVRRAAGPAIWVELSPGGELRAIEDGRLLWSSSEARLLDAEEAEILAMEADALVRVDTASGQMLGRWALSALDAQFARSWAFAGLYSGDGIYFAGTWMLPSDADDPPRRTALLRLEPGAEAATFRFEWDGGPPWLIDDGLGGVLATTQLYSYREGTTRAIVPDGSVRFEREAPYLDWRPDEPVWRLGDRLFLSGGSVLDASTGAELYAVPGETQSWFPVASGGLVHYRGRERIFGFDPGHGSLRYQRTVGPGINGMHATAAGTLVFAASDYVAATHICEVDGTGALVRDVRLDGHGRYGATFFGGAWMAIEWGVSADLDRLLIWRVPGFSEAIDSPGSPVRRP